jgi:predicted deacylase
MRFRPRQSRPGAHQRCRNFAQPRIGCPKVYDCAWTQAEYTADMTPGAKPAKPTLQPPLAAHRPEFPVAIPIPNISPFLEGNTGIRGFTTRNSGLPGPHVLLVSLIHGNEIAGATILAELLRENFMPRCGRLTLGFANIAAFRQFDPDQPLASRCIEEDLNRVWDDAQLFGVRRSLELDRARAMRPLVDSADILLDLHSMLWPSDPILLCGQSAPGRELAMQLSTPPMVVADQGHAGGRRLIDYGRFTESANAAAAMIVEAGQHWEPAAIPQTRTTVMALLQHTGMAPGPAPVRPPARFAQVTHTVTPRTNRFVFTRDFRGGEIIPAADTLIAHDGNEEIRTPFENCVLVMPSLRTCHGHTAVRLARLQGK